MWTPKSILTAILAALGSTSKHSPSPGCFTGSAWECDSNKSSCAYTLHCNNNLTRHALLHLPGTYSPPTPAPLIVALHGKSQSPTELENHTQFSNHNHDSIVVYPEGINLQWTGDPASPPRRERDDIAFIAELVSQLFSDFCIDTRRVYGVGFSNGGGLTHLLACDPRTSSTFAAFAASSAALYRDEALQEPVFGSCGPTHVILYLEFHGDNDPVIHYDGLTTPDGPTYAIPQWLAEWADRNTCRPDNKTTRLYAGKVTRTSWDTMGKSDLLQHYFIRGFGHGWPSTLPLNNDGQRLGPTVFNATAIILEFVRGLHCPLPRVGVSGKDEI